MSLQWIPDTPLTPLSPVAIDTGARAARDAAEDARDDALIARDLARDWATKTSGTVDGVNYSAKYWATNANVTAVAGNMASLIAIATSLAAINTVATNIADVAAVAAIAGNVTTVALAATEVGLVAGGIAAVNTVAGAIGVITTVAGSIASVNAVAAIAANVTAVAGATANVSTVAGSIANVNLVGGSIANVNLVAPALANIATVAGALTNIGIVAGSIANVNTVGDNITAIGTVVTNIVAIQNASANAAAAASAVALVSPYIAAPAGGTALIRLLKVELFKYTSAGLPITVPTRLGVRDFARDAVSGGRFRLRLASYDGVSTYTEVLKESTGAFLVAATQTGVTAIPLYASDTSLGVAANTIVGVAYVNFGAGETFGTYAANNITWATGGLVTAYLTPSAAFDSSVNGLVNSNDTVSWLNRARSHFVTMPTASSSTAARGLLAATKVTIFPQYALGSSNVLLRWCGRRSSDSFFWAKLATYDGVSTYTDLAGTNGNNATNATGYTGLRTFTLTALAGNALSIAAGTVIGYVEIDFGTGAAFGTYATNLTWAEGGLINDRIQMGTAEQAAVNNLISTAASTAAAGDYNVFTKQATNAYLPAVITDCIVENGDVRSLETYYISKFEAASLGSNNYRARVTLADARLGIEVATWSALYTSVTNPFGAGGYFDTNYSRVLLAQGDLGQHYGVFASVRINWSAVVTQALITYSGVAQTGIHKRNVKTRRNVEQFKVGPDPKRFIFYGTGLDPVTPNVDNITGYPTLAAAIATTYLPGVTPTYSTFPNTNISSFGHQLEFQCAIHGHVETVTNELVAPPYSIIRGLGRHSTRFEATGSSGGSAVPRPLECTWPVWLEDLCLYQKGTGYVVHSDNTSLLSKKATASEKIQRWAFAKIYNRVHFKTDDATSWGYGCGIGSDEDHIFRNCWFERTVASSTAFLGFHDSPAANMDRGGRVHVIACDDIGHAGATVTFGSVATFSPTDVTNQLIVSGGNLRTVALAANWERVPA